MLKLLAMWPIIFNNFASLCNYYIYVTNHTGPQWPYMALYVALLPAARKQPVSRIFGQVSVH